MRDADLVNYAYAVRDKLLENDTLRNQAHANTKKQFDESDELNDAILDAVDEKAKVNSDLANQIMSDSLKCDNFKCIIRDSAYWAFMAEKEKRDKAG